jgi:3-oxoacyl-[acyl-carrier-protein] synthase III
LKYGRAQSRAIERAGYQDRPECDENRDHQRREDAVQGLATQETVSAVMETSAATKEGVIEVKGLMKEMMEEFTATHEDVRYVRNIVTTPTP